MPDIIQMPYEIVRQIQCDWDIDWRSMSAGEGTDGVEQIFMQMPRFVGTPSLSLYDDLVKVWRATRAKARGRVHVYRMPLIDHDDLPDAYGTEGASAINGTGLGDGPTRVTLGARAAGATDMTIDAGGTHRPILGGFISIADWPYTVTSVAEGTQGRINITVAPPLRRAVPTGSVVNLRAHGLFKATEDAMGAISVGANGFAQVDLSFVEWLGPGRA